MKVAMIGQKGIPATYGGVERHVEELAVRLVECGHDVTVYTRPHYDRHNARRPKPSRHPTYYRGVRLVRLPSIATKHLDAISHVALCTAHAVASRADIVHYHAVGPALLCWIPRLFFRNVVVTVHAQDALRSKWGRFARVALSWGEWIAIRTPNATICVSESLAAKLSKHYGRRVEFIPNGVALIEESDDSILAELDVERGAYILFASRLVPEKGCHYLIQAWQEAGQPLPLVMAGDSSFSPGYVERIKSMSGGSAVKFPGNVYGARLASLFRNATVFVLPSDLEGLPIVLLEALGYGVPVVASDIPPNCEVMGEMGKTFVAGDIGDLRGRLLECLAAAKELKKDASLTASRIAASYDWDVVTRETIAVYTLAMGMADDAVRQARGRYQG